jgi:hypothetical protein
MLSLIFLTSLCGCGAELEETCALGATGGVGTAELLGVNEDLDAS